MDDCWVCCVKAGASAKLSVGFSAPKIKCGEAEDGCAESAVKTVAASVESVCASVSVGASAVGKSFWEAANWDKLQGGLLISSKILFVGFSNRGDKKSVDPNILTGVRVHPPSPLQLFRLFRPVFLRGKSVAGMDTAPAGCELTSASLSSLCVVRADNPKGSAISEASKVGEEPIPR